MDNSSTFVYPSEIFSQDSSNNSSNTPSTDIIVTDDKQVYQTISIIFGVIIIVMGIVIAVCWFMQIWFFAPYTPVPDTSNGLVNYNKGLNDNLSPADIAKRAAMIKKAQDQIATSGGTDNPYAPSS